MFVNVCDDDTDARHIMSVFRKTFKPDPQCNDGTFDLVTKGSDGIIEFRRKLRRDEQADLIFKMFQQAVDACVSPL